MDKLIRSIGQIFEWRNFWIGWLTIVWEEVNHGRFPSEESSWLWVLWFQYSVWNTGICGRVKSYKICRCQVSSLRLLLWIFLLLLSVDIIWSTPGKLLQSVLHLSRQQTELLHSEILHIPRLKISYSCPPGGTRKYSLCQKRWEFFLITQSV